MLFKKLFTFRIQIGVAVINSSQSEKRLGEDFDNKLKFDTHINKTRQKANGKQMPN